MRALLDISVWLPLLDQAHVFAERVNDWFARERPAVATCPIVENGVVRIMSQPAYSKELPQAPGQIAGLLAQACANIDHEFWPDHLSLRDAAVLDFSRLHGHRQITDAYLLALAVARGGVLVTLDAAIPLSAVPGAARRHLNVL